MARSNYEGVMPISPRAIEDLLDELNLEVAANPARVRNQSSARPATERLLGKLPLVHRTGKKGGAPLADVLVSGRLSAGSAPTDQERDLGLSPSTYFFLGSGAYPHGNAALLLETEEIVDCVGQFSPFDSGALGTPPHLEPAATSRIPGWSSQSVRTDKLRRHTGDARDLHKFASAYIPAHFRDPLDYARRNRGKPDWPTYHGLESPTDDARAWTIEVRAAKPILLSPATPLLLADVDLLAGLPASAWLCATVPDGLGNFQARISGYLTRES
jgi:hypothetical protein